MPSLEDTPPAADDSILCHEVETHQPEDMGLIKKGTVPYAACKGWNYNETSSNCPPCQLEQNNP